MSEYLKNLQENVILTESFHRIQTVLPVAVDYVTEEELKDELQGIFEDEESLDTFILEFLTEGPNDGAVKSLQHLIGVWQQKLDKIPNTGQDMSIKSALYNKINAAEKKIKSIKSGVKDVAKGATDKAVETAETVKGATQTAGEKVGGAVGKVGEYISQNPGTAAGIAVGAAAAVAAGLMAYKRFFSKGAKACKNAPDRSKCMGDLKKKAMSARIQAMNAGKAKCANTKNPAQCKAKIDQKIAAAKTKLAA